MGLTRADLVEPGISEEEKAIRQSLFDRYMECDAWAKRALQPIGVLLTSHPGNRAFLKASVETHKKLGYWLVLSYDNYLEPGRYDTTPNHVLPARDVMDNIDVFLMPHYQTWGGVLYPYFWLLKFGVASLSDFDYIYCANGDCILEHPENFNQLMDILGDGDIMGCGWEGEAPNGIFNTAGFIAKTSALKKLVKHMQDYFIPYDNYEKYTQEFGNCERRFAIAIEQLGLKNVIVENCFNMQLHKKGYGTWYKTVGFRHIHAEYGYAYKYKEIPPEIEYYDPRYMGGDMQVIKEYWETKDITVLEKWWKS